MMVGVPLLRSREWRRVHSLPTPKAVGYTLLLVLLFLFASGYGVGAPCQIRTFTPALAQIQEARKL